MAKSDFLPDDQLISAYLDDHVSDHERERVEQLIRDDSRARQLLDEFRTVREGLQALPKQRLGDQFHRRIVALVRESEETLGSASTVRRDQAATPIGASKRIRMRYLIATASAALAASIAILLIPKLLDQMPDELARIEPTDTELGLGRQSSNVQESVDSLGQLAQQTESDVATAASDNNGASDNNEQFDRPRSFQTVAEDSARGRSLDESLRFKDPSDSPHSSSSSGRNQAARDRSVDQFGQKRGSASAQNMQDSSERNWGAMRGRRRAGRSLERATDLPPSGDSVEQLRAGVATTRAKGSPGSLQDSTGDLQNADLNMIFEVTMDDSARAKERWRTELQQFRVADKVRVADKESGPGTPPITLGLPDGGSDTFDSEPEHFYAPALGRQSQPGETHFIDPGLTQGLESSDVFVVTADAAQIDKMLASIRQAPGLTVRPIALEDLSEQRVVRVRQERLLRTESFDFRDAIDEEEATNRVAPRPIRANGDATDDNAQASGNRPQSELSAVELRVRADGSAETKDRASQQRNPIRVLFVVRRPAQETSPAALNEPQSDR